VVREENGEVTVNTESETAIVFASDYLNKNTAEKIERECRVQLASGCKTLVLNFRNTEIVNSVGISVLLSVIDAAASSSAKVVFSEVNEHTNELFELLGLTSRVEVAV